MPTRNICHKGTTEITMNGAAGRGLPPSRDIFSADKKSKNVNCWMSYNVQKISDNWVHIKIKIYL